MVAELWHRLECYILFLPILVWFRRCMVGCSSRLLFFWFEFFYELLVGFALCHCVFSFVVVCGFTSCLAGWWLCVVVCVFVRMRCCGCFFVCCSVCGLGVCCPIGRGCRLCLLVLFRLVLVLVGGLCRVVWGLWVCRRGGMLYRLRGRV